MSFLNVLRAEWTKFRTVRGWLFGTMAAAAVMVGLGLMPGMQGSCGQRGPGSECVLPVGPEGGEVSDSFHFVHRTLSGDGSITVRVSSLTGRWTDSGGGQGQPIVVPWAKAGLILKDGTKQGSAYAAVMVTRSHGVRMQHNYTHDIAGVAGTVGPQSPRWLRLSRAGDTLTGHESTDGLRWSVVGTVEMKGLPSVLEGGLFATSPQHTEVMTESLGVTGAMGGPSQATATFDRVALTGGWAGSDWTGSTVGRGGGHEEADGVFTLTGSGDIAPAVAGAGGIGTTITQTLVGTFAALIFIVVVAAMFVTAEYRRGMIRTSLTATPRRGRVLAAKAMVVGGVTFSIGLVAAAVVVVLGQKVLRDSGVYVHAVSTATEVRAIVGTAALLAMAAVLALAIGALLRRSATAVAAVIVVIVLPYLLAVMVLPAEAAQWLLRVTPAAAFAIQQSAEQYAHVDNLYTPIHGYFPLSGWAGIAVLGAWTALAMAAAGILLRRRDA